MSSHIRVGQGNKLRKAQIKAVKIKREYMGQSTDQLDILCEMDGTKIDVETPIRVNDKKAEALDAVSKAESETINLLDDNPSKKYPRKT